MARQPAVMELPVVRGHQSPVPVAMPAKMYSPDMPYDEYHEMEKQDGYATPWSTAPASTLETSAFILSEDDSWRIDARNPYNWPLPRRLLATFVPCMLSFVITFSTSVTVPGTASIALEFGVGRTVSLLPLTLYTLGIALGPMVVAPLSEPFGRKPVLMISHGILLLMTVGAGTSKTLAGLLICRFLAGGLGTAAIATGAGCVTDIWQSQKASGIAALLFTLGPFLGPTLGPIAGAYTLVGHGGDWRWTQWLILCVGGPLWLLILLVQETNHAVIQRGIGSMSAKEIMTLCKGAAVKPTRLLFGNVVVASLTVYTAFAYAVMFSVFGSMPYILQNYYAFEPKTSTLPLAAIIIGYFLGAVCFAIFDKTLLQRAARRSPTGLAAPEHRLYSAFVGAVMLPISLFWYAWEVHRGGHWAALVAAGIPFGLGVFSIFLASIVYMVEIHGSAGASSAIAANGLLRYSLGAVFPLFTVQMYQNLGPNWASTLFACLSVLLAPIPFLLFRYGPKLRAMDSGKF